MKRQHVIIVGAGASGLIAAVEIAKRCEVTILENNSSTGGRIRTLPMKNGEGVIEPGAEFVHGDTPVTMRLVKEAGLQMVKLDGKMLRREVYEEADDYEKIYCPNN